jgi:hypothetical protein
MANLASELISDSTCGEDYRQQNPLVVQAYAGMMAFEPVYRATCLQDPTTKSYCFVEASTNSTNPADFYPYYTAIGLNLPPETAPTCSQCLRQTMQIFAGYAQSADQPLAKTYLPCASQVDASCGTGFAATDVKVGSVASSDAAGRGVSSTGSWWALLAVTAVLWIDGTV